jgi:glucose/arabinose dehydrogenase
MRRLLALTATAFLLVSGAVAVGVLSPRPALAQQAGGFDLSQPQDQLTGLAAPWDMAFLPDGTTLITERDNARVLRIDPVGGAPPLPPIQIPGVATAGEGGLLGMAVHPNYQQNGWVYVYHTAASDNRIVRFQLGATGTPQNLQPVLTGIPRGAQIHNGGRIRFGPDGLLYAATGDAGTGANSQNLQSLAGKILRMTDTGGVAPGNPFGGSLVYSYGHRNVQGLAFDGQSRLWASEFGATTWDEINLIQAGGNYGWPTVEGMGSNPQFVNPLHVWTTAEASPSGAVWANGHLFIAALRGQRLWVTPTAGTGIGTPTAQLTGQLGRLRAVTVGPDGWLWVLTNNTDGRGTPRAGDDRIVRFPPGNGGGVEPGPPSNLAATAVAAGSASLSWGAGAGASSYQILRAPGAAGGTFGQVGTATATSFTDSTVAASTTYRYQVISVNAAGSSPPSNTVTVTTPPGGGGPGGGCSAAATVQTSWGTGYVVQPVTVTNTGSSAISDWTVTFTLPAGHTVTGSWNATLSPSGQTVSAQNMSYNGNLAPGAETSFGFQASRPDGSGQTPSGFTCTAS